MWAALGPKTLPYASFGIVVGLVGVVLLDMFVSRKHQGQKTKHPLLWREHRLEWIVISVIVPIWLLFWVGALWKGMPLGAVSGISAFLIGLFFVAVPIYDSRRLYYLGAAFPTMALGVAIALSPVQAWGLAIGGWLVLTGFLTAGIMRWQLLRSGFADAPH